MKWLGLPIYYAFGHCSKFKYAYKFYCYSDIGMHITNSIEVIVLLEYFDFYNMQI